MCARSPFVLARHALLVLSLMAGLAPGAVMAHSDPGAFGGGPANLSRGGHDEPPSFRATVRVDPRRVQDVVLKVNARIVDISGTYPGRRVARGDVLMSFDSPELETVQKTFLETSRNFEAMQAFSVTGNEKILEGRINLEWRGLSPADVQSIEESHTTVKTVAVRSPVAGFVLDVAVVNGEIINAGAQSGLFSASGVTVARVAEDAALTVEAEVPNRIAATLRDGAAATVSLGDGTAVQGTIDQIAPLVVAASQTRLVRIKPVAADAARLRIGGIVRVSFGELHEPDHD